MKRRLLAWVAIAIAFATFSPSTTYAQDVSVRLDLKNSLDRLDRWLARGSHQATWNRFLQTDVLRAELERGDAANVSRLEGVLQRYSGPQPELSYANFAAVRLNLEGWIGELQARDPGALPQMIRAAEGRVRVVGQDEVTAAKDALRSAVIGGRREVTRLGPLWQGYLRWDDLEAHIAGRAMPGMTSLDRFGVQDLQRLGLNENEIAAERERLSGVEAQLGSPDEIGHLQLVVARFNRGYQGLQHPSLANVRRALEAYIPLLRARQAAGNPAEFEQEYRQQLARLADALESYIDIASGRAPASPEGARPAPAAEAPRAEGSPPPPPPRAEPDLPPSSGDQTPAPDDDPIAAPPADPGRAPADDPLAAPAAAAPAPGPPAAPAPAAPPAEPAAPPAAPAAPEPMPARTATVQYPYFQVAAHEEALRAAAEALDWLDAHAQAPQVTAAVRRHFWQPNMLAELSERFVVYGFRRNVSEPMRINENMSGTQVVGSGHTSGHVQGTLVPFDRAAVIHNIFRANTGTRTTGYNSGATIQSAGSTSSTGIKQISIDAWGLRDYPATSAANTNIQTLSVDSGRYGLFRKHAQRIAWGRVNAARPGAEARTSQRAEDRVRNRLDEGSAERVRDANERLREKFHKPLADRLAWPTDLVLSSTPQQMLIRWLQSRQDQIAGYVPAPAPRGFYDLRVRVHESMVNNLMHDVYSGRRLTRSSSEREMTELFGKVPRRFRELDEGDWQGNWEIVFSVDDPITIKFLPDDQVMITFRTTQITNASGPRAIPMQTIVQYQLLRGDDGLLRAVMIDRIPGDDPNVPFVESVHQRYQEDPERFTTQATTAAGRQLAQFFERMFDREIVFTGMRPPGAWAGAGDLIPRDFEFQGPWLTIGWMLGPPRPENDPQPDEDDPPAVERAAADSPTAR